MHDDRSPWPRRPERSSSKVISSSWGSGAARDYPCCARAALVQRSFATSCAFFMTNWRVFQSRRPISSARTGQPGELHPI